MSSQFALRDALTDAQIADLAPSVFTPADHTLAAMRVAHIGVRTIAEVVTATHKLVAELPTVLGQVATWRSIILSEADQLAYARAALTLRYPGRIAPITPQQLLAARRPE